jgi:hypothetical protein
MKKPDLMAHFANNIRDATPPTKENMAKYASTFHALTNDKVLKVINRASKRKATGQPETSPAPSDSDSEASEVSIQLAPGTTPPTGALQQPQQGGSTVRTKKRRTRSPSRSISPDISSFTSDVVGRVMVMCPKTTCQAMMPRDQLPAYCAECGTPWGARSAFSSHTTTTAATPTPRIWQQAATFRPATLPSLIPQLEARQTDLTTPLDSIIKKAREGTQHYTLADLMHPRAFDNILSSALEDERSILLRMSATDGSTIMTSSGAEVSLAKSQAARRRPINGMADIDEVFFHSLFALIYHDRPDICQHLFSLLVTAHDIDRRHGWRVAHVYIESIRRTFWQKGGGSGGTHVTDITLSPGFDQGTLRQSVLDASMSAGTTTNHNTPPPNTGGAGQPRGRTATQAGPASGVCNDWNRGRCKRTNCRYTHSCSSCGSTTHSAQHCSTTTTQPAASTAHATSPTATVAATTAVTAPKSKK